MGLRFALKIILIAQAVIISPEEREQIAANDAFLRVRLQEEIDGLQEELRRLRQEDQPTKRQRSQQDPEGQRPMEHEDRRPQERAENVRN